MKVPGAAGHVSALWQRGVGEVDQGRPKGRPLVE